MDKTSYLEIYLRLGAMFRSFKLARLASRAASPFFPNHSPGLIAWQQHGDAACCKTSILMIDITSIQDYCYG